MIPLTRNERILNWLETLADPITFTTETPETFLGLNDVEKHRKKENGKLGDFTLYTNTRALVEDYEKEHKSTNKALLFAFPMNNLDRGIGFFLGAKKEEAASIETISQFCANRKSKRLWGTYFNTNSNLKKIIEWYSQRENTVEAIIDNEEYRGVILPLRMRHIVCLVERIEARTESPLLEYNQSEEYNPSRNKEKEVYER